MIVAILLAPLLWVAYFVVQIPLILVGTILVPVAATAGAYKLDPVTGYTHWTWPLMFLYDNQDDGIVDPGYGPFTSTIGKIIYWSAIRNPVDNLKYVPLVCVKIDPTKVRFVGSFTSKTYSGLVLAPEWKTKTLQYDTKVPQWWFAWQGAYSGFYYQFRWSGLSLFNWQAYPPGLYLLWVGAKIKPGDIYGVETYRTPRAPSGAQFNRQAP